MTLFTSLLSGCGGGNSNTPANALQRGFEFNLTTPKTTYKRGEDLQFTFTVKNNTPASITTTRDFGLYMIQATLGDQVLWYEPQGGIEPKPVTYAPGETKTFDDVWRQVDINNNPVPFGTYTISAWLPVTSVNGEVIAPQYALTNLSAHSIEVTLQP
jgi:hypothetical protein